MKNLEIDIPVNRLKHNYLVGKLLEFIGRYYKMSDYEQMELFMLGYLHDSMLDYEKTIPDIHANLVGSMFNWKYSNELKYHSTVDKKCRTDVMIWLQLADLMVHNGEIISLNEAVKINPSDERKAIEIKCSAYGFLEKIILENVKIRELEDNNE